LGTAPAVHAAVMTNDSAIILPPRWRCTSDPERGVVVVARQASVPPSGVPPEVVLCRTRVDGPLASWRSQALDGLAERLDGFDLEDEDDIELDGRDVAYRRFAHRVGLAALVSDQWAWLADGVGVTLTCTVAREDYAYYCDVFEAVAETVDPERVARQAG
jgi:hypothetical protein